MCPTRPLPRSEPSRASMGLRPSLSLLVAKEAQSEQVRISAWNALLDRGYGRSQGSQLIQIELPDVSKLDGITTALSAIITATATGQITPSEAQALSSVIETQRKAIETVELEERIEQLEQSAARRRDG